MQLVGAAIAVLGAYMVLAGACRRLPGWSRKGPAWIRGFHTRPYSVECRWWIVGGAFTLILGVLMALAVLPISFNQVNSNVNGRPELTP